MLSSIQLSNSTYAALSIRDGDLFAKQFGGSTGNDPDFFRVTLTGFDSAGANGNTIGDISINLADFTFSDNSNDYILDEWLEVDLTSLSAARSIQISYASSDMTTSGLINTPTYLAVDNLTLRSIPEPNTVILLSLLTSFWGAVRRRTQ